MKLFLLSLPAIFLAAALPAADLSSVAAEAAKYESGSNAEPLRQLERALRESAGDAAARAEVEAALVKLLAPSATFEAQRFACTQLAIIGTDASLPAIAELLRRPDTTGIACLALGSIPSPKVNELLRAALPGAQAMARAQIIATLGDRRDAAAVKPLAEIAQSTDRACAEAAIVALGKIATEDAFNALVALYRSGDPELARLAVLAGLVAADTFAHRGDTDTALTIFNELVNPSQPAFVRRAAFEGLLRLDADGGEERARAALHGEDAVLKAPAIACVRTLKSPGASAKFARELAALSPTEQAQMIESLAARNDAAARDAITEQLVAPDATVRRAAVVAFAEIGDAGSVPALAKALSTAGSAPEQQTLELVMASLKGGAAVDSQITALLTTGASVPKANLINVLARRGSQTAVPTLLELSGGTDASVAGAAFRALGKLAGPDRLPALLDKLVTTKDSTAREEAANAAAKIMERTPDAGRRYDAIARALTHAGDVETRCALVGLLPVCGDSQALRAVEMARDADDPKIREAGFRALVAWPDALAIDPLLEIAASDSPKAERVVALRGCVRLLGAVNNYSAGDTAARFQKTIAAGKQLNEGKLVLAGLANVHHPLALGLIEPFLGDPEVRAEAALAAVNLAPYVCGVAREPTRAVLKKIVDLPVDKNVKQSAQDLLEVSSGFGDFLMAWQVAGPFSQEGKDGQALFDVVFPPEQAGTPGVPWQAMPVGNLKARPWELDLGTLYGGNNRVAYARTWIYSETQQPARLEFGSDDGLKVWLNGQVVLTANRGGDVIPAAEKAAVTLKQGWNPLVLKVTQWTAGWGFCARVAKPDGSPIPGVRVELNPVK